MVVWSIFFLEIPDLEPVVMGWVLGINGGSAGEEDEGCKSGMGESGKADVDSGWGVI